MNKACANEQCVIVVKYYDENKANCKKIDAIERQLNLLRIALTSIPRKDARPSSVWRETAGSISAERATAMLQSVKRSRASAELRLREQKKLRTVK